MGISRDRKSSLVDGSVDIESLNARFSSISVLDHAIISDTLISLSLNSISDFEVFNFSSVSCKEIKKHILAVTSEAIGYDG